MVLVRKPVNLHLNACNVRIQAANYMVANTCQKLQLIFHHTLEYGNSLLLWPKVILFVCAREDGLSISEMADLKELSHATVRERKKTPVMCAG